MEDKNLKKELAKIPDVDENGDPIYKIDEELSEESEENVPETPLFLENNPDAPKGNKQDIKDSGEEE